MSIKKLFLRVIFIIKFTPLHMATRSGSIATTEALVGRGARADVVDHLYSVSIIHMHIHIHPDVHIYMHHTS